MAALFPTAYLVDTVGRRWSIIVSSLVFIAGAIGQTFVNTAATASPSLLAELAHTRQRAQITYCDVCTYMTCFYIGSITAAWSY